MISLPNEIQGDRSSNRDGKKVEKFSSPAELDRYQLDLEIPEWEEGSQLGLILVLCHPQIGGSDSGRLVSKCLNEKKQDITKSIVLKRWLK